MADDAPQFDRHRFEELVLYLAEQSAEDPHFGKTKLAKLLAFIDFASYQRHGHAVTGATYVKLEFGPAPKELPSVLTRLEQASRLHMAKLDRFGYEQTCIYADDEPRLDLPTEDRAIVDEVLEKFRRWNNSEISELAHRQFVGWQIAREMESIPYRSVILSPLAPTERELKHGRELAAVIARERGL